MTYEHKGTTPATLAKIAASETDGHYPVSYSVRIGPSPVTTASVVCACGARRMAIHALGTHLEALQAAWVDTLMSEPHRGDMAMLVGQDGTSAIEGPEPVPF